MTATATMNRVVIVLPFEVVLLSDVSSIGYSALNVNPILEQFQNFWIVFYFPQGCRLASPMPIMARGIRIAASIVIVMMSIVLPWCRVVCSPLYIVIVICQS